MLEDKFVEHFSSISPLNREEQEAIRKAMIVKTFQKGSILLREGEISRDTFFILKGCVREFINADGEEKTTNFFTEEQWLISLNNFGKEEPSLHQLICMEETIVVVGNEEQAQEMFKEFPRFETISRAVMEQYFGEQRKLLTSYLTDSPEQRYLNLMKNRPDLLQRIPQYHLASYIGVKPESLSRIRKRILNTGY